MRSQSWSVRRKLIPDQSKTVTVSLKGTVHRLRWSKGVCKRAQGQYKGLGLMEEMDNNKDGPIVY